MKRSAIAKNTVVMTVAEFKKFLVGKTTYYYPGSYGINKWSGSVVKYFPYSGFLMGNQHKFRCLGSRAYDRSTLKSGKAYWDVPRWKVSIADHYRKLRAGEKDTAPGVTYVGGAPRIVSSRSYHVTKLVK